MARTDALKTVSIFLTVDEKLNDLQVKPIENFSELFFTRKISER